MQSSILMWLIIHSVAIDILGLIRLCGDVARSLMPFECFSICIDIYMIRPQIMKFFFQQMKQEQIPSFLKVTSNKHKS